jgi:glycerol dehydrogenase
MIRQIRSAQCCAVGPGAAAEIGFHAAQFGTRALVMGGARAVEAVRPALLPGLDEHRVIYHVEQGDHVRKTRQSVDALAESGRAHRVELVVACGGGAVMDAGKGVARDLGVPLVNVPTVASTNACGTLGYRLDGDAAPRPRAYQGADVIVADTAVIARAGGRFLASGMGDAVPTWYGAQLAIRRGAADVSATRPALARLCTETILADGARAYRACERGEPTPDVDRVVEAIVYCSGVAQFGMAGDHILHPAEMAQCRREAIHGEWVAFGLLVRIVLGGEFADDLPRLLAFFRSVDLPTRFADFGLDDPTQEDLLAEARRILGASSATDFGTGRPISAEAVAEAMREVDYLGRQLKVGD